jgi:archaellum component FlaC
METNVLKKGKSIDKSETDGLKDTLQTGENIEVEGNAVKLKIWGFKQAGIYKGDDNGLINSMQRIYGQYLNELSGKQNNHLTEIQNEMDEVKTEIAKVNNEIDKVVNTEIPEQQRQIEEFKNDIEKVRVEAESGFIASDFNWTKTILFTLFALALGLSLVFFYTSLVYNAVFKNAAESVIGRTGADAANIFNTLLDVRSLFTLKAGVFFSYLFSTIFLSMGLLLHNTGSKNDSKIIKVSLIGFMLLIALIAELIFAYKIEKNIDELKSVTILNYQPAGSGFDILFSVDVMIVILLGFISYLIWSFVLEGAFSEWRKRNPRKLAKLEIRELEKKINRRKYRIGEFNKRLAELKGQLNILKEQADKLKRKMNLVFFKPLQLEERLEEFFGGWLAYVKAHKNYRQNIVNQQKIFVEHKEKLLKNEVDNLNWE